MWKLAAWFFFVWSGVAVAQQAQLPRDHPPVGAGRSGSDAGAAPRSVEELIRELDRAPGLATSEKPFHVAYSVGRLYYVSGRFQEAATFLQQAVEKGEALRKLYRDRRARAGKRELPAVEKAGCGFSAEAPLEELEKVVARQAGKDAATVASCARLALRPVLDAEQILAEALFSMGDPAGALSSLEHILETAPDHPEALFAHATVLFENAGDDLRQLKKARAEWERFLALQPGASNAEWTRRLIARADEAIAAGGFSKLEAKRRAASAQAAAPAPAATSAAPPAPGAPPPLSRETVEAFRNAKITPEMERSFAKLISEAEDHLARGSYQKAMDNYRQVMPYQPENGRLRAGMAWALIGLNRQPMADNIWRVAVGSDPAAVEKLGEVLEAKGDSRGAKALWGRLASSDPEYATRSGLKSRLEK